MKLIFKILLSCAVMSLTGFSTRAQVRISSEEELELLKTTPLEAVYLHGNASFFFPGEYLFYSLYVINTRTYRLSGISKVAYVQLVGETGNVVFTQKVRLEGGKGQGDYFFPTDLPSGNYKLVAFTHWMKNAGPQQFFRSDLTFLNPYRSDQGVFLSPEDPSEPCPNRSGEAEQQGRVQATTPELGLELGKDTYGTQTQVTLQLRNYKGNLGDGTYSLSVRKVDNFPHAGRTPAVAYARNYPGLLKAIPQRVNDLLAIPEQRGELISGTVLERDHKNPLADRALALSLPGPDFQIKKARTDSEGKFYTYLTRSFEGRSGIVELLAPGRVPATFQWYAPTGWAGDLPCFYRFQLKEEMRERIRQRSIHNQIENSYFEVKPDTLQPIDKTDPFEGETPITYRLDDYTRFSTLRETIVEILEHVWVKRGKNDRDSIMVYLPGESSEARFNSRTAMVVMDGILVPDHGEILGYDARKIETVKVVRQNYQLGGTGYQGMLVLETSDRQFEANWESPSGTRFDYLPPLPPKKYFKQAQPVSHIPDFRYQLLWEPNIRLEGPVETFSFYTSQVPGRYEVVLEGYTTYGKPISLTTRFEVAEQ